MSGVIAEVLLRASVRHPETHHFVEHEHDAESPGGLAQRRGGRRASSASIPAEPWTGSTRSAAISPGAAARAGRRPRRRRPPAASPRSGCSLPITSSDVP